MEFALVLIALQLFRSVSRVMGNGFEFCRGRRRGPLLLRRFRKRAVPFIVHLVASISLLINREDSTPNVPEHLTIPSLLRRANSRYYVSRLSSADAR